jgi:hypothetical protein
LLTHTFTIWSAKSRLRKTMAVTREKLYSRVEKTLRTRFTKFDGWYLEEKEKNGPDFTFALTFKNRLQKVICMVNRDPEISPRILAQMRQFEKAAAGEDVTIFARIIALPEDVPVSSILRKQLEKESIELLRIPTAP